MFTVGNVLQKTVERTVQRSTSKSIQETTAQSSDRFRSTTIQKNIESTPIFNNEDEDEDEDERDYDADFTEDDQPRKEDENSDVADGEYENEEEEDEEEDDDSDVADGEYESDDEDSEYESDDEDSETEVDEDESDTEPYQESESESETEDRDKESESESESETETESESDTEDRDEESESGSKTESETKSETESETETNPPSLQPISGSESDSDTDSDDNQSIDVEAAITEKELDKTDPTIVHTETNSKFYYLSHKCEDSDHLTPKYTKEISKEGLNVVLYLYTICDHQYMSPFVSLLLEYNSKDSGYDFPQFLFTAETQTDENDTHEAIMEKTLQIIYKIFEVKATEKVDMELFQQKDLCYKGLLEMGSDSDVPSVVLCIDVTPYLSHLKENEIYLSKLFPRTSETPSSYTWVVIDEVLRHKTQNIPISPIMGKWVFSEDHDFLLYIRKDGEKIQNPKLLYHCILPDEDDSVKFETSLPEYEDTIHVMAETSVHPKIGEMIYFSEAPIQEDAYKNIDKLNRFVVFVDNPIEFTGKPETWDLTQIEMIPSESQLQENENQTQDIMDAFETKKVDQKKVDQKKKEKSVKEIKTAYSSVMFEQQEIKMYGIKSPNFYCIL